MVLDPNQIVVISFLAYTLFFVTLMKFIYHFCQTFMFKANRWKFLRYSNAEHLLLNKKWLLSLFFIQPLKSEIHQRKTLLHACGIKIDPLFYMLIRRMGLCMMIFFIILSYFSIRYPVLLFYIHPIYISVSAIILWIFLFFDTTILESLKSKRREKIVKEIFLVSNHLLYFSSSHLHLHTKLTRCIHMTNTIRPALEFMLNEWYQDQELAIHKFKERLDTDEAFSFAETLNVIRLNESDGYYQLLRQRIQDFKERIDLMRESRHETLSYLLFVIAGVPILNTFRVFLYPWIAEGQKLFNGLN